MRTIEQTGQFRRDYKREARRPLRKSENELTRSATYPFKFPWSFSPVEWVWSTAQPPLQTLREA